MKLNLNVLLLKEGATYESAISETCSLPRKNITIGNINCDFYSGVVNNAPAWVKLFDGVPELDTTNLTGRGARGLLLIERQNRVFAITYGHARHLVEPLKIERYFGLLTALSLSDPQKIKSIDKANIDRTPLRYRAQSSKQVGINEFEFKFDWEILKSLTGVVEGSTHENMEVVSGNDSLSLHTDYTLADIPNLLDRLIDAYSTNSLKDKYPWIGNIVPETDKETIEILDLDLLALINSNEFEKVWAAPPDMIEYKNFAGFCYKKRTSSSASQTLVPDLDLENCLNVKNYSDDLELTTLKSTKVFVYDGDYKQLDAWSLYLCLNAEIELDGKIYLLNEGEWYSIDRDFAETVNQYFDNFPHCSEGLPSYQGRHEPQYLKDIADGTNRFLMDAKLVKPRGASSSIEFCDLITKDHHLIHVKKYSSSSALSHLFSQAYVSAETLIQETEIVSQVNTKLHEQGYEYEFTPLIDTQPRGNKIVLAIMQKKAGPLHMPFFSKVNFRQYSQKIISMGFDLKLLKVSI